MTQEQLDLLLEYIDARIAEHNAADSSDGGLIESIQVGEIRTKLIHSLVRRIVL